MDDDRSIYAFRGANRKNLLRFQSDYKELEKIYLSVNYKSTDSIIAAAGKVIAQNKQRLDKRIEGCGRSKGRVELLSFVSREK